MAKGQGGEYEHHVVAARLRVIGAGNLLLSLSDYDDVQTFDMAPLSMLATTRFEPTRLSNIQSQRIRLIGGTQVIDEWFHVSRIVLYAKQVAVEYPQ